MVKFNHDQSIPELADKRLSSLFSCGGSELSRDLYASRDWKDELVLVLTKPFKRMLPLPLQGITGKHIFLKTFRVLIYRLRLEMFPKTQQCHQSSIHTRAKWRDLKGLIQRFHTVRKVSPMKKSWHENFMHVNDVFKHGNEHIFPKTSCINSLRPRLCTISCIWFSSLTTFGELSFSCMKISYSYHDLCHVHFTSPSDDSIMCSIKVGGYHERNVGPTWHNT